MVTAVTRLLCKHRDGPKWGGGTAGDLQKGENAARSQNLQSSKASLFFLKKKKEKKKNILSPRQVTEVQTWVPPLGTFSR